MSLFDANIFFSVAFHRDGPLVMAAVPQSVKYIGSVHF